MDITTLSSRIQLCYSTTELASLETELTMTSREIAELTGKRHDNVVADIRNTLNDLQLDIPSFQDTYFDKQNRKQIEFCLNEELTLTLISGYSVQLRNTIVKQWLEMRTLIRTQQLLIEKQAQEKAQAISDKLKIAKEAEAVADRRLRGCKDLLTCFTPGALSKRIKQDPEWRQTCLDSLSAILKDPRMATYYAGEHDNAVKDLVFVQDKLKELRHFVMTYCKLKPEGVGKPQPDLREALSYKRNFLSL